MTSPHHWLFKRIADRIDALRWRFAPPGDDDAQRQQLSRWREDELARFRGWDFSYLGDRVEFPRPTWDYIALARAQLTRSRSVLDMATGGGEIYREILTPPLPAQPFACEGYRKNLPVARATLGELGVEVRHMRRVSRLPFADGSFDLVLNRHGGFDAVELRRIMRPGGVFLTQQIDGDDLDDLCAQFGQAMRWHGRSQDALRRRLEGVGFVLERDEHWSGAMVFHDVGALVYFLHAVPWFVPGFQVSRFRSELLRLQQQLTRNGRLVFHSSRSLFVARRPGDEH